MKFTLRRVVTLALALCVPALTQAQSSSQLSLSDVLQVAVQRSGLATGNTGSPPYQASSWLAGLPSLSVSYLESDERDGVDETELSLNLPIKSSTRRRADKVLQGLSDEFSEADRQLRELYFSGLIREAVWSYSIADAARRAAGEKRQLLLQMEKRQADLVEANASSQYSLLLLRRELVDVELSQQDFLQQARQWLNQYREITGLGAMPQDIREPVLDLDQMPVLQHPRVNALELAREQRLAVVEADSAQAESWKLSVNAKNLSSGSYDEDQYGLALEMPLSFINIENQSANTEWQTARREYKLAMEQTVNQLRSRWRFLAEESRALAEKQRLLSRAGELSRQIAGQVKALQSSNEIAQEIALRRMMDAIDTRTAAQANQLLIHQNQAMLRQAAGLPL